MDAEIRRALERNLTIDNAIDLICQLEDNQNLVNKEALVKWKSYSNQIVVESDNYFYKVYEEGSSGIGPFFSEIRKCLTQAYSEIGMKWDLVTFERSGRIYDIEQRQKLRVASADEDGPFENVYLSASQFLDRAEVLLEFETILGQIKENSAFRDVASLKLVRNCVNKYDDYGFYKGKFVILDDADFFVALVGTDGKPVIVDPTSTVDIKTSYGEFEFSSYIDFQRSEADGKRRLPPQNAITHGWYLLKKQKMDDICISNTEPASLDLRHDESSGEKLMEKRVSDLSENINLAVEGETSSFPKSENEEGDVEKRGDLKMDSQRARINEDDLLYSNNLGRKSYQWELWQCCNNLCKFCYLGLENRHTDKERQIKSLNDLMASLETLDYKVYNNISLIGGEFFQGQLADEEVSDLFFKMIGKLAELYVNKKIGSVWITATLTIGDQADLYKMLDIFDNAGVRPLPEYGASGIWICTSWDPRGRFRTEKNLKNWEFHMNNMKAYYPWVKRNTTIILQQKLCEMYLNGEYNPKEFMEKFDTFLFYKQPGFYEADEQIEQQDMSIVESYRSGKIDDFLTQIKQSINKSVGFQFYPDRKTFRKFLLKYAKEDPDTYERLFNIMFRSDELHRNFNEIYEEEFVDRDKTSNLECSTEADSLINDNCRIEPRSNKHITNYATYNDCNECMICDRNQIWESVYGKRGSV